jgi:hypothetical protein
MINKNVVFMGLACSFLHGTEQTATPVMNDENSVLSTSQVTIPSIPSPKTEKQVCSEEQEPDQNIAADQETVTQEQENAFVSEPEKEETETYINCNDEATTSTKRDVIFQDDLSELLELDENCKRHCDRFKQLNIIIKAVNEYHCPRGEKIEVTIENNRWTIVIKNITEDLLLEKYLNLASHYMTKVGIYIWGKTLARYAKCTVVINGVIHPEEEHILCSDVIIDIVDWSKQKLLNIRRYATDLLNTQIVISKK